MISNRSFGDNGNLGKPEGQVLSLEHEVASLVGILSLGIAERDNWRPVLCRG